jgi:hypothetical protein
VVLAAKEFAVARKLRASRDVSKCCGERPDPKSRGAFAVVDIDTLWRRSDGVEQHWLGRVCKVYAFVKGEWKMTAHTGALDYSVVR